MSVDRYRSPRPPARPRPPRVESSDEFLVRHGLLDAAGPATEIGLRPQGPPARPLPPPPGSGPSTWAAAPGRPTTQRDEGPPTAAEWARRRPGDDVRRRPAGPGGSPRGAAPQTAAAPWSYTPAAGRPTTRPGDTGDSGRFTIHAPGRRTDVERMPGYASRDPRNGAPPTGVGRRPAPDAPPERVWPANNGRSPGGHTADDGPPPGTGPAEVQRFGPGGPRARHDTGRPPARRADARMDGRGRPLPDESGPANRRYDLPADGLRGPAPESSSTRRASDPPAGHRRSASDRGPLRSARDPRPDGARPDLVGPAADVGVPAATVSAAPGTGHRRRRAAHDEPGNGVGSRSVPDDADAPAEPVDAREEQPRRRGRRRATDPAARAVGTSGTGRSVARARADARTTKVPARTEEPADDATEGTRTARGTDARTTKAAARRTRTSPEPDDGAGEGAGERLRADRIDETVTRLTAAHAGLVLGRHDEDGDEDGDGEADDTPARRGRRAVRAGRYAVAAVAFLLVLAAGLAWAGRTRLDGALTQVAAVDVALDGVVDAAAQAGDENVLVIATDSGGSAGATTRANTVTVVHRDARGGRAVAVTLPPRLEITRPPCERFDPTAAAYLDQTVPAEPRTTFDSAYALGGPRCATRAAQQVTGLAITRFVAVDLAATSALVESVGGVQVCVERPVLDSVLGPVAATAGTDAFNGARAAALVRAADVRGEPAGGAALVQRQQRVLAAALERALSPVALLHPGRVGGLLPALGTTVVSTGTGVADLLTLSSASGEVRAVPVEPQLNSRNNIEMRETDAQALFTAVRTEAPLPAAAEAPAASVPDDVTADVLNASGREGLAAEVAGTLGELGFATAEVRNADQPALDTVVRFSPDRAEQAQLLAAAVPSANAVPDPGTSGVLQLVLGRSFDGTVRASSAPEVADVADPITPAATCG